MNIESEKQLLLKKIIYRAKYRGTKELDSLLGNFVTDSIGEFDLEELKELMELVQWSEIDLYRLFTEGIGYGKLSESLFGKINLYIDDIQNKNS